MTKIWSRLEAKLQIGLYMACLFLMTEPLRGVEVSTFSLGRSSQPALYYQPAFMHGVYAFDSIRVTFNVDVFVDFYDLQLQVVGADTGSIPMTGFTYDAGTRAAVWTIADQGLQQNARYLATLRGVFDAGGAPLPGGEYTNVFTILTCDVTGDDQVTPVDTLTIINHLNGGLPYQPVLDINWDGAINPTDVLLTVNFLNTVGNVSLVSPGEYRSVPMNPPPQLAFVHIREELGQIVLKFSGLPAGSLASVTGKVSLLDPEWYAIMSYFVTDGSGLVSFPVLPVLSTEFYRASFQ